MRTYAEEYLNRIQAELDKRYAARPDGCDHITITMNADGGKLTLTPCLEFYPSEEILRTIPLSKHNWVLVESDNTRVAITMGGEPREVCRQIADYANLKQEYEADITNIWKLYNAHKNDTTPCCESNAYETYSDWHKELFGYRPRGWVQPPVLATENCA